MSLPLTSGHSTITELLEDDCASSRLVKGVTALFDDLICLGPVGYFLENLYKTATLLDADRLTRKQREKRPVVCFLTLSAKPSAMRVKW